MTTVATFDEKMVSEKFDAVFENLVADESIWNISSIDDVYDVCKNRYNIAKSEFTKFVDYFNAINRDDSSGKCKLTELELEMIAGGFNFFKWAGDCLHKAATWVKNTVAEDANFVKDKWNSGVGGKIAIIGVGVAAVAAIAATAYFVLPAASSAVVSGAVAESVSSKVALDALSIVGM